KNYLSNKSGIAEFRRMFLPGVLCGGPDLPGSASPQAIFGSLVVSVRHRSMMKDSPAVAGHPGRALL
ncbi:MAG TPA: hypothetical protein PLS03_15150, partial [Terrimicrobiaceae bacterium]|nr:hypothetical protein [Terrimicrobiaceae bacterium]